MDFQIFQKIETDPIDTFRQMSYFLYDYNVNFQQVRNLITLIIFKYCINESHTTDQLKILT